MANIPLSIIDSEKSDSNPNIATVNDIIIVIRSVVLIIFSGFDIL